jgi:hypothetical protein
VTGRYYFKTLKSCQTRRILMNATISSVPEPILGQ